MKRKGKMKTVIFLLLLFLVFFCIHEITYYMQSGDSADEKYNLEKMKTGKIAVLTGTTMEQLCYEAYPDAKISSYSNMTDTAPALLTGKSDYLVTIYTAALNYLQEYPDELVLLPEELRKTGLNIGFTKGEDELREKCNERIAAYQQDGTLEEIQSHWLREDGSDYAVMEIPVLEDAPKLVVATAADDEPMSFIMNGEIVGFDSELIQRIAYDLGYRVEFMDTNFTGVLAAVSSGKARVAISNMTETKERAEAMDFSIPYYENSTRVLIRRNAESVEKLSLKERLKQDMVGLEQNFYKTFVIESRWKLLLSGLGITMVIALLSSFFGTVFGAALCLLRMRGNDVAQNVVILLVRMVQGIPILVILLFLYFVVFKTGSISGVAVAVISFSINFGVYVSEMLRVSILAVKRGQYEAALALGYKSSKAFQRVILPQAAVHFLPVYKGEFVSLFKSTSIVGYIAIQDLTKMSDMIRSRTYEAFFPLLVTAVVYFLLSYICAIGIDRFQRRYHNGGPAN